MSRLPTVRTMSCVALAFLAACSDANPVAPDAASAVTAHASANAQPVPIRGTGVSLPVLNFSPPAGRCTASHPVLVSIHDTVELSHLGRTLVDQGHCIAVPGSNGPTDGQNAYATFTAANGDKIFATYGGSLTPIIPPQGPPTQAIIYAPFTFTGGTGRFAHVTGEMTARGIQIFFGTATVTYDGWIAY